MPGNSIDSASGTDAPRTAAMNDDILPMFAAQGYLGQSVLVLLQSALSQQLSATRIPP